MRTATLTRPALRLISLPADATWTNPQPPQGVRPCETRPANWWDTGDPGNGKAKEICGTCPFKDACKPSDNEDVAGTIRAGVAYDDTGHPITPCRTCGDPILRQPGNPVCVNGHGGVARHHDTIVELRDKGWTFTAIADYLGDVSAAGVNRYWTQYLARIGHRAVRVDRLPGVTADSRNRAQDYHDVVIDMLSDLDAQYTYQEVAYAIGSTTDSVKSHWRRHQKRAAEAGQPVINRRCVSYRPNRHRPTRVPA